MEKFKGTKGAWLNCNIQLKDWSSSCVGLSKGKAICHMYYEGTLLTEEVKANALLISKAPKMLEILEIINECRNDFDRWGEIEQLIKSATDL